MKKLLFVAVILMGTIILSGCSSNPVSKDKAEDPKITNGKDGGYLQNRVQTLDKTKDDINSAVQNQNDATRDALSQAGMSAFDPSDRTYVNQYSGAVIKTSAGDITVKFYTTDAPMTVNNFLKLSAEKFYVGTKFHRVIKKFMIQGGDPNSKDSNWADDGQGGPGYTVPAEIKRKNTRGTIATARLGDQVNPKKESSGSQFFINTVDNAFLDGNYTVFGEVTSGMDVVDKIEAAKTNSNDHPLEDIVIIGIELLAK